MKNPKTISEHRKFMEMAVEAARRCSPEDKRIHPFVGSVIVKDGMDPIIGFRGEQESGEHAEFTALEKLAPNVSLVGATIYATLEPCTKRNAPKVPCVERIIERKISRVYIGMLDPNEEIRGKGMTRLRKANISVQMFDDDLCSQIEEMNRDFTRYHEDQSRISSPNTALIEANKSRRLDEWYRSFNKTYWNQNFQKSPAHIFSHLVEVVGGLSGLASSKTKSGVTPERFVAKAIAWWMALCGKMGVKSVEDMLWSKFPGVCPYCHKNPHNPDICSEKKESDAGIKWDTLREIKKRGEAPRRIKDWQLLYSSLYPASQTEDYGASFARLAEELGELAEAVRIFDREPGYFLSEAADVFAWLMHIQNIVESKNSVRSQNRGNALEELICSMYPDGCVDCGKKQCSCPPILPSTIGRIAHEVPEDRSGFNESGSFMSPDKASTFFLD